MPRQFFQSTAEDVVASVEAVVVNGRGATPAFVAEFGDFPLERARNALKMAVEMGFLSEDSGKFSIDNPLGRLLVTASLNQRTAVFRVVLETYEPFVVFRQRLLATGYSHQAAQQTKVALGLIEHRDGIKDTLISFGTYSRALRSEGGGVYVPADQAVENQLLEVFQGCGNVAAAEARIGLQIGTEAVANTSRDEVLLPLAEALLKAAAGDAGGAVTQGGNAVESFLVRLAGRTNVDLGGATGINAKLEAFSRAGVLPKKLIAVGRYLGNVRNAADHGIDGDVGAAWIIQESTGTEFVYVACSFIRAVCAKEDGSPLRI